ncbi:MAG: CHAT domain-containing protein, partial [Cyclobacteriaceae bacterium]
VLLNEQDKKWGRFYLANYYKSLAYHFEVFSDSYGALKMYSKYLGIIEHIMPPNYFRLGEVYKSLSILYQGLGKFDISFEYLQLSADVYSHQQDYYNLFRAFVEQSEICAIEKNYSCAISYLDKIINLIEDEGLLGYIDVSKSANILKLKHLYAEGSYDEVLSKSDSINRFDRDVFKTYFFLEDFVYEYYLKSLIALGKVSELDSIGKRLSDRNMISIRGDLEVNRLNILNILAERQLQNENPDSAFQLLNINLGEEENIRKVLKSNFNQEMSKSFPTTLKLCADVFLLKSELENDVEYITSAMSFLRKARDIMSVHDRNYNSQFDRIKYLSDMNGIYERMFLAYYKLYIENYEKQYLDSAFNLSEKAKSSILRQAVQNNLAIQNTNFPDSLTLQIESLKKQSSSLTTKINRLKVRKKLSIEDSISLSDSRLILISTKDSLSAKLNRFQNYYQNHFEINFDSSTVSINEIQSKLKKSDMLLEYYSTANKTFRFIIDKDSIYFDQIPYISEVDISTFQRTIQPETFIGNEQPAFLEFKNWSQNLYSKLFHQFNMKENKEIRKLYIIPDKQINFLPFELLIDNKKKLSAITYKTLPYLIKQYNISYGYSSRLLFNTKPNKSKRREIKLLAVAPSYANILDNANQLAKLGEYRNDFQELKYNEEEVNSITNYFDSKILTGEEATESAVLNEMENYDILHFAMHALVDNNNSENSKFIFTSSTDSLDDSFLHNYELYNTTINCEMAVLS